MDAHGGVYFPLFSCSLSSKGGPLTGRISAVGVSRARLQQRAHLQHQRDEQRSPGAGERGERPGTEGARKEDAALWV